MSLHDDIDKLMGELAAKVPKTLMEQVGTFIGRLAKEGVAQGALKVGDLASPFSLQAASGRTVSLSDLLKTGPAVVTFFRGEWCPFCDLELRAYQKSLEELRSRGATLVAISPQSPNHSRSTVDNRALTFDVLSDPGNAVARAYGIAFSMNAAEEELHKAFGADIPSINASTSWDIPIPATFVVNQAGRIAWAHVDANYTTRAEPADVVRALDALKQ